MDDLRRSSEESQSRRLLADLKRQLDSLPSHLAAMAIVEFLADSTLDAPTQIEFSVGNGGSLKGHPSLRIALLDWLNEFDTNLASKVAESVLSYPTHPDEWAVCLRNHARANDITQNRDYLRQKTEQLISNSEWSQNPSVGFLEAFDVLVYAEATESVNILGSLVSDKSPEGKTLAHAAFLTLDRLTIRKPSTLIQQLSSQPELTKKRGEMVANMVARADIRDSTQREAVSKYLLAPTRTSTELDAFAGVYPNANFAISNNLLTDTQTPTGDELIAHDAEALKIINTWLQDPKYQSVRSHIKIMQRRLITFVKQAQN